MLETEIIDMITDELVDFLASYIVMTSMSHEMLSSNIGETKIEFGQYKEYYGKRKFCSRHSITKTGRTKIRFNFEFHKDELEFAMKLVRLLDGYVDYGFGNWSNCYNYGFTFDVGSKENGIKLFERLNLMT